MPWRNLLTYSRKMENGLSPDDSSEFHYGQTCDGMRFVCRHRVAPVEYCGVLINVGSRDESEEEYGLAHFIEHTIFKGTEKRRAASIINRMESIGGELNAYTTKEETAVYSIFPTGGISRAVSLIGDLIVNSVFPEDELNKERDVVLDELESYLDTPSEAVFDDYDELFFKNNSLAHNILGTYDSVRGFSSDDCRNFIRKYYTSGNMVFFYYGAVSPDKICRMLERAFAGMPVSSAPLRRINPAAPEFFNEIKKIDSHQSHTIMGAMTAGLYGKDRYELALLTNILGGPGMNSRLNIALRERRGLVYLVDATNSSYTDCGLFSIYFGCDHSDLQKCKRLVRTEVEKLADKCLTDKQLDVCKRQYLGQMCVARENNEQSALSMSRAFLYHNNVLSLSEVAERIKTVTSEQIRACASRLFDTGLPSLTLG